MRLNLLSKLLAINILLIAFVISALWLAIDYLAAGYFVNLMEKYNISPVASNEMFLGAVHRYLLWSSVAALLLGLGLSFILTRRVLGPLMGMMNVASEIAGGDYSGRVPIQSKDEIGELAAVFNRMAESLAEIEMLRKRMVIDVAHELRTPLTNIRGYLEALVDGVVSPTPETLQLLQNETLRLTSLVDAVMQLARAEGAKQGLSVAPVPLVALIEQAMEPFEQRFIERTVRVLTDFEDPPVTVLADSRRISRVIGNILQNAVQYTPSGGSVRISTEKIPGEIRVTFANSGAELDPVDVPFIFERFYRGEKSRSRDRGGAGIGLAIVKELVEAHHGRVGVETTPGETLFWFTLPL